MAINWSHLYVTPLGVWNGMYGCTGRTGLLQLNCFISSLLRSTYYLCVCVEHVEVGDNLKKSCVTC